MSIKKGVGHIPEVRIERSPVKMFGLGILGFDHLDLAYIPNEATRAEQERWYLIEGVRDFDFTRGRYELGVVGWDGGTTLSDANAGRVESDLIEHFGSPEDRGGRTIVADGRALETWSMMAGAAADIARAHYPYIAYSPVWSPLPTLNSSSLISSLLFHAGFDFTSNLPLNLRFSPGLSTLILSSGDDRLRLPDAYEAVLGGDGNDTLMGRASPSEIEKLYGGRGDDTLVWSPGRGIRHGGEPGLPYAEDGTDRVSYAGAGPVEIVGHLDAAEHAVPDFTATFPGGKDDLFSIEELVWDDRSDHVTVGPGAGLIRSSLSISTHGGGDWIDASRADASLFIDSGEGNDVIIAGRGPLSLASGPGRDVMVLADEHANVRLLDASAEDRLDIEWTVRAALIEHDAEAPQDAVLSLYGEHGSVSTVHLANFERGMLGLCVKPPARVPLQELYAGAAVGSCESKTLSVWDDEGEGAIWSVSADGNGDGHF